MVEVPQLAKIVLEALVLVLCSCLTVIIFITRSTDFLDDNWIKKWYVLTPRYTCNI